jgi:glycosyltransferase involved in cell wall biosynthesis
MGPHDVLFTQKLNPLTVALVAMARLRNKATIVDWDDFDTGLQASAWRRWLAGLCERWGPHLADVITTHSELIAERARDATDNVFVVPQGFDHGVFNRSRSVSRARWGLSDEDRVIGYLCTFTSGGAADLPIVLDAWKALDDRNIRLLLIGGGPRERRVRDEIARRGLADAIRVTGLLRQDQVAGALACLDVGVVFMSNTPANRARVSMKVIEYLAMGVPVVGQVVGETERLFGSSIVCATAATFVRKIQETLEHSPLPADDVVHEYRWHCAAPKLARAFSEVCRCR